MRIERFEDIEAWKKARELTNLVYDAVEKERFSKDYSLSDQIRRASISSMANIAEGFGSISNKEFIKFLNYSYRSCFEIQSHLYIALDRKYITQKEFDNIYNRALETIKLINGFVKYLKTHTRPN